MLSSRDADTDTTCHEIKATLTLSNNAYKHISLFLSGNFFKSLRTDKVIVPHHEPSPTAFLSWNGMKRTHPGRKKLLFFFFKEVFVPSLFLRGKTFSPSSCGLH